MAIRLTTRVGYLAQTGAAASLGVGLTALLVATRGSPTEWSSAEDMAKSWCPAPGTVVASEDLANGEARGRRFPDAFH